MTTKDLENFFNRANKLLNSYNDKMSVLDYDYFIITSIIFTSDIEYQYLFTIFKDNKVIEKILISDKKDYYKTFKDLTTKYKTNVIYNYNDLTTSQLRFLQEIEDITINQDEVSNMLFKKEFDAVGGI